MNEAQDNRDISFVAELVSLLRRGDLSNLEVEQVCPSGRKLTVRLGRSQANAGHDEYPDTVRSEVVPPSARDAEDGPVESGAAAAIEGEEIPTDPRSDPDVVKSPMVGTVYLQPGVGAPLFVEINQEVTEGQTLLIVEAMKTMNHIAAPHAGIVSEIFVQNEMPVEFGAPLMRIS